MTLSWNSKVPPSIPARSQEKIQIGLTEGLVVWDGVGLGWCPTPYTKHSIPLDTKTLGMVLVYLRPFLYTRSITSNYFP